MIRNYLTVALRNLLKRKVYSFINLLGLGVGISVCLVIWKYVEFELSYDDFHKSAYIYRIVTTLFTDKQKIPNVGYDLGPALLSDIPEVKTYVRTHSNGGLISYDPGHGSEPIRFEERNVLFVDSTFLDVFTFETIRGNASTALDKPSSIVVTESMARKYFGKNIDPMGKTLHRFGWVGGDYEVTAVLKDLPQNSHLTFDFLVPMSNLLQSEFYKGKNQRMDNFYTYVEVRPQSDVRALDNKMPAFINKYLGYAVSPTHKTLIAFQPIRTIHLSPALDNEGGDMNTIYFFIVISIFILGIAWVNYINLSTARAMERAKEVGVKKAIGVRRNQLIVQFIFESVLLNLLAMLLAVGLAIVLLPILGNIVDKQLSFDFSQSRLWLLLTGLFLVGSFISGFYPALVLSSFKTTDVIKGNAEKKAGGGLLLRKALVVFQFTASLVLIASTFTIFRQIQFMQNEKKGFNMNQMLIVNAPYVVGWGNVEERLISFKNELLKISSVRNVTSSGAVPGGGHNWETHMLRKGASKEEIIPGENINVVFVDEDFVKTYGMQLKSGRIWNPDIASDLNSVLINEAAIVPFGLGDAQKALEEKLVFEEENATMSIVGVLKNYHWKSLKTEYLPTILWPQKISFNRFSIQLTGNIDGSVKQVEQLYKKTFPGNPFDYYFLDDFFNAQYKVDQQFEKIFSMFAILAIVIACLGLWGLASFTTLQRLKEISIRKVLGASVSNILSLLSSQFFKLLFIASLIALPITWYAANSWLANYAFRIGFSWESYVMPVVLLIAFALGTISIQIVRGAKSNPAEVLRAQ